MTLDQLLQCGEDKTAEILEMTKPTKTETTWRFFQYILAAIFPWMKPVDDIIS